MVALNSAVAVAAVRGGTNETDLLYGTAYADTIYALADGDALVGCWGNDRVYRWFVGFGEGTDWDSGEPDSWSDRSAFMGIEQARFG